MSIVTIRNVEFINNPAHFKDVYRLRVTFECISPLSDDLEWKLIYVCSQGNEQELGHCSVGPVLIGINSFDFEGGPPDPTRIPDWDVLGVAALILTASYKDQEFVRMGYYQNTKYDNEEMRETPPATPEFELLVRDLSTKPRVTKFQIKWDHEQAAPDLPSSMSVVTIRNVEFLNNPARFLDPYKLRMTLECISPLSDDLEWKLIYVYSPGNEQELDNCSVGPVPIGTTSFEFEGGAPDSTRIPDNDVLGEAALILTASYKDQEFVRMGYYQNTKYDNEEMKETPPATPKFELLVRDLSTKPRVTEFQIKWDHEQAAPDLPSA